MNSNTHVIKALKVLHAMIVNKYWSHTKTPHCGEEFEAGDCIDCSHYTICEASYAFNHEIEMMEKG